MFGRLYIKLESDEAMAIADLDDTALVIPWHSSMEGTSTALADAERLAVVQAGWLHQFGPSGEHLVLFRLTKDAALLTRTKLPERAPGLAKATERCESCPVSA